VNHLCTNGNKNKNTVQSGNGNRIQISNYNINFDPMPSPQILPNPEIENHLLSLIRQDKDLCLKLEAIKEYNRLTRAVSDTQQLTFPSSLSFQVKKS